MNFIAKAPDQTHAQSGNGRLILMALWALVIAAIGKPPAPQAAELSSTVSLKDLDLSTDSGQRAARDRVHSTAVRLCDRAIDHWSLSHFQDFQKCVAETTASAMGDVQKKTLVAANKVPTQSLATP
jgi:UrcA family protein